MSKVEWTEVKWSKAAWKWSEWNWRDLESGVECSEVDRRRMVYWLVVWYLVG